MLSLFVLRQPTRPQTQLRVRRDRKTGIVGRGLVLTTEPTREELETWAIQIGFPPADYLMAWACQADAVPRGS